MDTYAIKARYTPAILTIIPPIVIFNYFFASIELNKLLGGILAMEFLSNLTISGICLYYFSQLGRLLGKEVFERWYFDDESRMPSTNFLMHNDPTFSVQYKEVFAGRVLNDFGFQLPNQEEQEANEYQSRRRIVEIMALIRKKLAANTFLMQHNIEYGAMRNAVGGALVGALLCSANIVFFKYAHPLNFAVVVNYVLFTLYVLLLLSSKFICDAYGRSYAKILFREYIGR